MVHNLISRVVHIVIDKSSFLSPFGKLLGKVSGPIKGNVLLRKEQYRISDDEERSISYAKNFILGKIYNQKFRLRRGMRDHGEKIDRAILENQKFSYPIDHQVFLSQNESHDIFYLSNEF